MGGGNKDEDYAFGMSCVMEALHRLAQKVELDQDAVYEPRVRKPRAEESKRPTKEERQNRTKNK